VDCRLRVRVRERNRKRKRELRRDGRRQNPGGDPDLALCCRTQYKAALDQQVADRKSRDDEAVSERRQVYKPVKTDTIEKQAW